MITQDIRVFKSGVQNLLNDELIPQDGASDSLNFLTQDGRLKLIYGRLLVGASGVAGKITGEIFGYKVNGTKVHWRKKGTIIQYLAGSTWTNVVTGLTSSADYTFANYSSLAGTFTYAFGADGIYKFHNAVPASFNSMYDSAKNFKGSAIIDKGRTLLWNRLEDKTGLYGSYIDLQNATVYTTVAGEATTSLSGTLTFKAGGATRNCFGVTITLTGSGEVYTDAYLGVLSGSLGGTGTINYISGAYTLSNAGVGTAGYRWEDSNIQGVTDFSKSSPRTASQGFLFPQDEGGDAILSVMIGEDTYFSMKKQSVYRLTVEPTDLVATNEVYRKDIGIPSARASVSTSKGVVFLNTANPEKPEVTILQRNPLGDSLEPYNLFPQFKFSNYVYDDCTVDVYERYIIVACKTTDATNNDILLLCDIVNNTVDITNYSARTFAKDAGDLYMGSSITENVYQLFDGFDDDGFSITNYWIGKGETWDSEKLKKYRKLRLKGSISPDQSYQVYLNYDNSGFQLVGTVVGSGSYVDYSSPMSIGSNMVGNSQIGGDTLSNIYPYFAELRLKKMPKFRKRSIKFVAMGIGYVDIESHLDLDIQQYQDKIPSRFRQKQNVNLSGTTTDNANPEF